MPLNWPKWERIEKSPELVAKCRGLSGQVWEYIVSHGQLLVRFYAKPEMKGVYLFCKCVDVLYFEAFWDDADLKFNQSPGKYGPIYHITDGNHLRIECSAAFIGESAHPIYVERVNDD